MGLTASHPRDEEQASQTNATSDAREQRGEREEAEAKGGNDARETRQRTQTNTAAVTRQVVFMQSSKCNENCK
jgi:hypothetical protein